MPRRLPALAVLLAAACVLPAVAQKLNPVRWTIEPQAAQAPAGANVLILVTATIEPGWHLYGLNAPRPIIPTSIRLSQNPAIAAVKLYQPTPRTVFDPNFRFQVGTYQQQAVFRLQIELGKNAPAGPLDLLVQTRWQTCNDQMCLPPRRAELALKLTIVPGARAAADIAIPPGYTLFDPNAPVRGNAPPSSRGAGGVAEDAAGLAMFLLAAFGFGLAAVFTPCVFPMIPITVSYFLSKPAVSRGRSAGDALLFALGIIVLFSGLGLIATAILGPFGALQLGSNVWVNGFVALVFLVFALSLLGAFEITLPSRLLTRLDRASKGGGALGALLMGLTFSLTAFACVGPFMGTLLAASVASGGLRPLGGMIAFAGGLATPFFLLALFPAFLKRLPKSGGWLERVKVVMGFLILAAMFKYLSAIDQVMQWNLLTRERFLAAWIVLFAAAGLYLLGLLRLPGTKPEEGVGLARLLAGAALLVFALSLVPGMFGARLGELDAYVPAASESSLRAGHGGGGSLAWMKNQYREALERARRENRRVLVAFSGYACTNCHWMKANMFTRPEIAAALEDYVLVELYTDGLDPASQENQALEQALFATVAIPYYAILDPDGKVIATFPGLTRDSRAFLRFLLSGAR
ncbi:MAG: cytochrome c biogenesis protein CcdA [Bryobacteraceae bacterium]